MNKTFGRGDSGGEAKVSLPDPSHRLLRLRISQAVESRLVLRQSMKHRTVDSSRMEGRQPYFGVVWPQ
jgi:hypothetical protein